MGKSSYKDFEPADFSNVETYDLESRPSKVTVEDFATPPVPDLSLAEFFKGLPDILAAKSLLELAKSIRAAKAAGKPIIWGIGGHVIKTGLSPVLIELLKKGFVSAIACNGSVLVHDSEIAMVGFTSEDVDATLGKGDFGAARQTGELLSAAGVHSVASEIGLGEAFCEKLNDRSPEHSEYSLLVAAYEQQVPVTTHITIGADIGHFHPTANGADLGFGSHLDFKLFTSIVREMNGGGVYLNCGSAVTLPEVFLKAVTVNRNLGFELSGITTANFDFLQQYRPLTNVVKRPNANGAGKGYAITGHHEIMIPLLAAAILNTSQ